MCNRLRLNKQTQLPWGRELKQPEFLIDTYSFCLLSVWNKTNNWICVFNNIKLIKTHSRWPFERSETNYNSSDCPYAGHPQWWSWHNVFISQGINLNKMSLYYTVERVRQFTSAFTWKGKVTTPKMKSITAPIRYKTSSLPRFSLGSNSS